MKIFKLLPFAILTLTFSFVISADVALAQAGVNFQQDTRTADSALLGWLHTEETDKRNWLKQRGQPGGPPNAIDFALVDHPAPLAKPSQSEALIAKNTKALFDLYFPPNDVSSYVGTWIESGNPYIETPRGPYQWNSHWGSGIDQAQPFEVAVKQVTDLGIKSIRIGPNLYQIKAGKPETWDPFLDKIETIWRHGATPTISVNFFSSLTQWRINAPNGDVDYDRSYLLNARWPSDMQQSAGEMMRLLMQRKLKFESTEIGKKVHVVINPVNEPETFAGFNRNFWHGAHAPWGDPQMMKYYVPSIINIAKANVLIRLGIEQAAGTERVLFMHNEAMTPSYYPSHHGYGRFAISKFMLGDSVLLSADMQKYRNEPLTAMKRRLDAAFDPNQVSKSAIVNEVDWAFFEFVFGSWNTSDQEREAARQKLVALFVDLQNSHRLLHEKTGKLMRTDNFLDLDYYCQGEFQLPVSVSAIVDRLSANNGELLKTVLGVTDDEALMNALNQSAADAECALNGRDPSGNCMPGIVLKATTPRSTTDFRAFLTREDNAVLYNLVGLRGNFVRLSDADLAARQAAAGMDALKEELRRSDVLLTPLLANGAELLKKILNIQSDSQLVPALQNAALDTRDGGPAVSIKTDGLGIRDILNLQDRLVLHRVLGLKRDVSLGFEPQQYARQVRMGLRNGFYKTAVQYVNALRIFTIGVGESGTPFYVFAPLLHDQMMLDYAKVLEGGAYGTHYSIGPAVDTIGWNKGPLSKHYLDDHEMQPTGLMRIVPDTGGTSTAQLTQWQHDTPWVQTYLHDPQFGFFTNLQHFLPAK